MTFRYYLTNRRIVAVLLLGFSSGLPLALTGSTLQAWYTQTGVGLMTIGILSLIGLPYVWKFLWAPVLDKITLPFLGRRRGWIFLTQALLCLAILTLAQFNPATHAFAVAGIAFFIAFLSASQDIAIDAYRTDILLADERGLGAAAYTFAYRMGMLLSGGIALIVADHIGWRLTYELMAILLGFTMIATYQAPEISETMQPPKTVLEAVIQPFKDLIQRDKMILILFFILFYKIGDALALSLLSNFLLRYLHFSLTEVGVAFKLFGLLATIFGVFIGGIVLVRLNLFKALLLFGILQAFSNLMFMILALVGKNYGIMISSIFIENLCSGMGTAAFVAFIMSLCNHRYSATQFALLSAIASVGRVFLGPLASLMVEHMGWVTFFGWTFLLSFPGILLLTIVNRKTRAYHEKALV